MPDGAEARSGRTLVQPRRSRAPRIARNGRGLHVVPHRKSKGGATKGTEGPLSQIRIMLNPRKQRSRAVPAAHSLPVSASRRQLSFPSLIVADPFGKSSKFQPRSNRYGQKSIHWMVETRSVKRRIVAERSRKGKSEHEEIPSQAWSGCPGSRLGVGCRRGVSNLGAGGGVDASLAALPGTPTAVHSAFSGLHARARAGVAGSNLGSTKRAGRGPIAAAGRAATMIHRPEKMM